LIKTNIKIKQRIPNANNCQNIRKNFERELRF